MASHAGRNQLMHRPSLILTLLIPLTLFAQTTNYEGQKVGSVDLVTDLATNVQDLGRLVVQKAGEPYSNQKVEDSKAALARLGIFKQVNVQVDPETSGLHLMFVMEPAYYYGVIR